MYLCHLAGGGEREAATATAVPAAAQTPPRPQKGACKQGVPANIVKTEIQTHLKHLKNYIFMYWVEYCRASYRQYRARAICQLGQRGCRPYHYTQTLRFYTTQIFLLVTDFSRNCLIHWDLNNRNVEDFCLIIVIARQSSRRAVKAECKTISPASLLCFSLLNMWVKSYCNVLTRRDLMDFL